MLKIVYRFILQMARSVLQFQLMQRLRKLGLDVSVGPGRRVRVCPAQSGSTSKKKGELRKS